MTNYYSKDPSTLNSFDTRIHGRCGYIRQALPFQIKDYSFSKFSLHIDGVNSKLSDIDYLSASEQALTSHGFKYDVNSPAYFRKNAILKKVSSIIAPAKGVSYRDHYLNMLGEVLKLFDQQVSRSD